MSAFFCNDATLNKVVTGILQSVNDFCGMPTYRATPDWTALRLESGTQIGLALREMNAEAMRQRYNDTFPPEDMLFTFSEPSGEPPIALLKAMHCFGYQCAEGDVPENNPLYDELKHAQGVLADRIASALPEYDTASWGD